MLFIDGDHILSQEGTTQGDPLAMAMYAIGTLPLIHKLQGDVTQAWYADDASAGGRTSDLRVWWDNLVSCGPQFGYNPNSSKTWLVVKPVHLPAAEQHFRGSGVNITIQGHRHLGAPLGSKPFAEELIRDKISCWVSKIKWLTEIAKFQPQAAYTVYTRALTNRWTFLMRTAPCTDLLLQPLEEAIQHQFLPAVTGRQGITDQERELLALPVRHGGLGVAIPTRNAKNQFKACLAVTAPLVEIICQRNPSYPTARAEANKVCNSQGIEERRPKRPRSWSPNSRGLGRGQWNRPARKVPLHGLQPSPCPNTASTCTNRRSGMPSALGLAGRQQG